MTQLIREKVQQRMLLATAEVLNLIQSANASIYLLEERIEIMRGPWREVMEARLQALWENLGENQKS